MRKTLIAGAAALLTLTACGADTSPTATGTTSVSGTSTTSVESSRSSSQARATSQAESISSVSETTTADSSTPAATSSETVATSEPAPTGTVISTAASEFGEILFDTTGQAIYLFDRETSPLPDCYDECAVAWPPVLTVGAPQAAGAIDASLLGVTTRTDGSAQVTYAGHPLYFYADEGKNEVTCHDVEEYGGVWLVVTPAGSAAPA